VYVFVSTFANLDYAAPPKWYQKRRFQRWVWRAFAVALAPFLLFAAWMGSLWAHDAWITQHNRAMLASCKRYVPPRDQVVFEMKDGQITQSVLAAPWAAWWSPQWSYPTVFLHERDDFNPTRFVPPAGLVAVEISPHLMNTYDGRTVLDRPLLCFQSSQVRSVSTSRGSGMVVGSTLLVVLPEPTDHIRVFAGLPDPTSADRFTFDLEYNGRRQTVEGRLSGGVVKLRTMAGEALSPQAWAHATFWIPQGATATHAEKTRDVSGSAGQPGLMAWPWPAWWVTPAAISKR
jgi:hypothetical protein